MSSRKSEFPGKLSITTNVSNRSQALIWERVSTCRPVREWSCALRESLEVAIYESDLSSRVGYHRCGARSSILPDLQTGVELFRQLRYDRLGPRANASFRFRPIKIKSFVQEDWAGEWLRTRFPKVLGLRPTLLFQSSKR